MVFRSGCLICGEDLIYREDNIQLECYICKKVFSANATCQQGHYICDACHSQDILDLIQAGCQASEEKDPIKLANRLMEDPRVNMHGPEHHYLVPAVLLTSYYNQAGDPAEKENRLALAKERSSYIKGGLCGFYGICGASMGAGVFASVLLEASPLTEESWGYVNSQTGEIQKAMGRIGGPRCCKRNTYIAILEAARFLDQERSIKLFDYEASQPVCNFKRYNKECIGKRCPFFLNQD